MVRLQDHFKRINDTAGHAAGDQVLREIAELIKAAIRRSDFAGRLGGEEFAWALPSTGLNEASLAAERLRGYVNATDFGHGSAVTASFGVATLRPGEEC